MCEFKKYNISERRFNEILNKSEKNDGGQVLGSVIVMAILMVILETLFFAFVISDKVSQDVELGIVSVLVLIGGFVSTRLGISLAFSTVKESVVSAFEKNRCPHCKAPLSYHYTKTYTNNEHHYQKNVKKHDSKLNIDYIETQNWVKYDEYEVYTCSYCKVRDENVKHVEKRVDKTDDILTTIFS